MITKCSRCHTEVSFETVSPGYYAVCPEHDEDLFKMETYEGHANPLIATLIQQRAEDTDESWLAWLEDFDPDVWQGDNISEDQVAEAIEWLNHQ